jgi:oligopeptide/dipeptide ABC transporter ATP-binding protein
MSTRRPLLSVSDLEVGFRTEDGRVRAVDGVSFDLNPGEVVAIVGESGSGKSVTALTLMGLTRGSNTEIGGSATFGETDLISASEADLRKLRGAEISMIFQDPMSALNPVQRVGNQIAEQIRAHEDISKSEAEARVVGLLESVGISGAAGRARSYPHEFSGGMRQRAMIAMALSLEASILIADEPTTALDVTIQAQIMRLLARLNEERGLSIILITHDLGIVAEVADRVLVMYGGRIVEEGTLDQIFYDPRHPYTWGLLGSLARIDRPRPERLSQIPGMPPSLISPPEGCHFRPRCPHEFGKCPKRPELEQRDAETGHLDRCWLSAEEKREKRQIGGRIALTAPEKAAGAGKGSE